MRLIRNTDTFRVSHKSKSEKTGSRAQRKKHIASHFL